MIENCENFQKFLALEPEKQLRIINAAMKEFLTGFKKASTDSIVREAGISKGLLFHYFGTKERLYNFLIDYAIDTIQDEFLEMLNLGQPDIFDTIWQMSLLKRDISQRFPVIFEFLTSMYLEMRGDSPTVAHMQRFAEFQQKRFATLYEHCDKSLFRDGVDPEKCVKIVYWAMMGWADSKAAQMSPGTAGIEMIDNYDTYLEELREFIDIFRKCFYKGG